VLPRAVHEDVAAGEVPDRQRHRHGVEEVADELRPIGAAARQREHGAEHAQASRRTAKEVEALHSGTQAVTVISTRRSGALSAATVTVVRAGLLVGKYFAYSSL